MKTDGKPFQVMTKRPVRKNAIPRLPHERDESEDSQASGPRGDMKQAYLDIRNGQVDTDLRETRGVEEVVKTQRGTRDRTPANPPAKTPAKKSGNT
jgi:hypothetical protein